MNLCSCEQTLKNVSLFTFLPRYNRLKTGESRNIWDYFIALSIYRIYI